jgi:triacylglycerol lipase
MTISQMNFIERSAFFATLSNYAYKNLAFMRLQFPNYAVKLFSHNGADVYTLEDDQNFIVVCRGTEVKQFTDIHADLSISRTSTPHGKLHIGFNHYVDKIWSDIFTHVVSVKKNNKLLWLTGHSLGAAMATIMSYRFASHSETPTPVALFTYGSPRVGNRTFVNFFNTLPFEHHRWVNDGDIVTKIPFAPWFYHSGIMHHIDAEGYVTPQYKKASLGHRLMNVIKSRGLVRMLWGDAQDHSSDLYRNYLSLAEQFPIMHN